MSELSAETIDRWIDPKGPVALVLKEELVPVEGEGAVFFPPTYAFDKGSYNIDKLEDGTKVATIDSVGSQANRMEPLFLSDPELAALVPQVSIQIDDNRFVSILDAGHRLGDALVRSTELNEVAQSAFRAFLDRGDASEIAKVNPTALVFGVWDSRNTQAKLPRIVQSVIRAWDVSELTRAAQYTPAVDYAALNVFSDEDKKAAEESAKSPAAQKKSPLAQQGFVAVPSVGQHGGVVARGPIVRDVTINLIALRRLQADHDHLLLRRYILGLALVAATEPLDGFLRQGCLLVPRAEKPAQWIEVQRTGERIPCSLSNTQARALATTWATAFGVGNSQQAPFLHDRARKLVVEAKEKAAAKRKSK